MIVDCPIKVIVDVLEHGVVVVEIIVTQNIESGLVGLANLNHSTMSSLGKVVDLLQDLFRQAMISFLEHLDARRHELVVQVRVEDSTIGIILKNNLVQFRSLFPFLTTHLLKKFRQAENSVKLFYEIRLGILLDEVVSGCVKFRKLSYRHLCFDQGHS